MTGIFAKDSPYKRKARFIAIAWTLLIFVACLLPAKDIPEIDVPLLDKWVHFLLFGLFAFFWLCSWPYRSIKFLAAVFLISLFYGWLIETLQRSFPSLGRNYELMDIVADGIGGFLGVAFFYLLSSLVERKTAKS